LRVSALFNVLYIFAMFSYEPKVSVPIAIGINPQRRIAEIRYAQCHDDRATDEHCSLTLNFCVKLDDQTGQI